MNELIRVTLSVIAALIVCSPSYATVIDFSTNVNGNYFVPTVLSSGYVATSDFIEEGERPLGTSSGVADQAPSNGTVHLDSWTNYSFNSVWTLTKQGGGTFSLLGFDFANGYNEPSWYYPDDWFTVSSLTLTGARSNGTVTETFAITQRNFQTLTVSPIFNDLTSVQFDAFGPNNRAAYDNIVVGISQSVPEPATFALPA
jgi:hypothetical protein